MAILMSELISRTMIGRGIPPYHWEDLDEPLKVRYVTRMLYKIVGYGGINEFDRAVMKERHKRVEALRPVKRDELTELKEQIVDLNDRLKECPVYRGIDWAKRD